MLFSSGPGRKSSQISILPPLFVVLLLGGVTLLSVGGYAALTLPNRSFGLGLGECLRLKSGAFFVRYNTKRKGYDEGDEGVRNFFGRRRSGRSSTIGGGTVRRGRTVRGGTSSGTIELAIGTLVIVVLVVVLLRLLGLL